MSTPFEAGQIGFLQHRVGDLIKGRYEVLQRLGGGNFGSVYKVRDRALEHDLACKELHVLDDPDTAHNEREAALALFKREALNLATLRHPNIPAAYFDQEEGVWHVCPRCGFDYATMADPAPPSGRGETPPPPGEVGWGLGQTSNFCPVHGAPLLRLAERHYLMMDFVDGPTLEDLAVASARKSKPLDEKQCLEWIGQIASALRSLHRVGIIHRDVKPENIKIRRSDGIAMLLDFGLTRKVEEASGYGTVRLRGTGRMGTPGYAPASMAEMERPECRTDIYALGMTLFRILTGRDPQEQAQLAEMRAYSPRYFNGQISPEADRLIRTAAAIDITRRHQSIDLFLDELNAIQGTRQVAFTAPPFTFSSGQSARTTLELARLIEARPAEAQGYVFSGLIADWLKQNGFAAPAKVAGEVVKKLEDKPRRAVELVRRALYPGGAAAALSPPRAEPSALDFGALDSGETSSRKLRVFHDGPGFAWGEISADGTAASPGLQFRSAFEGNDVTLEITLDTGKVPAGEYRGALVIKTDAAQTRVPVNYVVNALNLTIEPAELDLGVVQIGRRAGQTLLVKNNSETGRARGVIHANGHLKGLIVPERFEGEAPLEIVVDGRAPGVIAGFYDGALRLDTNGGTFRVPLRYALTLPPHRLTALLLKTIAIGALGAIVGRLAYVFVNPGYAAQWLTSTERPAQVAPLEFKTLAPLVLGIVLGVLLMRLPRPKTAKRFEPLLPIAALLCGVAGGWLVASLGHFTLALGDYLLHPLAARTHFAPQNVLLWWAILGAGIGSVIGLGRAAIVFGRRWVRYLVPAVLSLAFLVLFIHAVLFAG